jgi:hypothetical protein
MEKGQGATTAHEQWASIRATTPDEETYCRLIGSLGLSPYEQHADIDGIIELLVADRAPASIVADLCQASDDSDLRSLACLTQKLLAAGGREINIEPLAEVDLPQRTFGTPPWQVAKQAAKMVRAHFEIAQQDPHGGDSFFEKLGIDPSRADVEDIEPPTAAKLSGGIERQKQQVVRIMLDEPQLPQRRFAAARAAFMGWACAGQRCSRLITGARTRDQQMSRAFAAELLAPIEYIRKYAGAGLSSFRIGVIASELGVSPRVIKNQALNNRLQVVDW